MNKSINLYPTPPAVWLWRDHAEDIKREFHPSVTIPSQDEPLWHECTEEDKAAYEAEWEKDHPAEPEVEDDWVNDTGDPATDPILSPSILAEEGAGV